MKKDIQTEYKRYCEYLESYFPETSLAHNKSEILVKDVFEVTMSLSKIAHFLDEDSNYSYFTNLIEYNLNNLLYFLPLNELVSYNVSIRNCTEAILKMIFTLEDEDVDHKSTGYRTMKDNRERLLIYQKHKNKIDNLFSIYSNRSNSLHLKKANEVELTKMLENKLCRQINKTEMNEIKQDLSNCKTTLLEVICFYNIDLSTQQKLNLKRFVSKSWIEKLYYL
ncbi:MULTISPECIES: hypothetical protein [Enterococcus]|jgi:hypothetical protein|uniref:hypothetical protein n=1 Tax=Enterococcus TaxID=1350 RepID=UPI0001B1DE1D|nr:MULTISPECIES: hypothetical protein [Enterococcus]MCU8643828.1 hypothetical protein [Escherichia coli]AQL54506.1 hypothetical protein BZG32_12680 [Enterococcus faecalis]AXG89329.1 hypothetical protein DTO64_12485 [Enterococcus faecalis]EET98462.1 predicted protein [Enterococcus faecalis T2]EFM71965.1 hypothetical protein HMPREF9515_02859 [Enterococcus faecalis TX0860]